jgi:hypothetical protein
MLEGELGIPIGEGHEPSRPQSYQEEDGRRGDDVHQMNSPKQPCKIKLLNQFPSYHSLFRHVENISIYEHMGMAETMKAFP